MIAEAQQLALLVARPWEASEPMVDDVALMARALERRGFQNPQIRRLAGSFTKAELLEFLKVGAAEAARWKEGSVILHVSGHGGFDEKLMEPHLMLSKDPAQWVPWSEIFRSLALPKQVQLVVLPDT